MRYPLFCDLHEKRCLVVGGGNVAMHKCRTLLLAGAQVTVIADCFHPDFMTLKDNPHLLLIEKTFSIDLWPQECWLVFAATDSPKVNQQILKEANARHCFCNVIDAPESASFISSTTINSIPPIQIALTCGGNPVYTQFLKEKITQAIPQDAQVKLEAAMRIREQIKNTNASRNAKRQFWSQFFTDTALEKMLQSDDDAYLENYLNELLIDFTNTLAQEREE